MYQVHKYDFEFIADSGRGYTGRYFGLIMQEYPVIPSAEQDIEAITIPGRDGELIKKGPKKNIIIPIKVTTLIKPKDKLEERDLVRRINRWLRGTGWLRLSDNQAARFRVLHINIVGDERITPTYGGLTIEFLCEPYEYAEGGFIEYPSANIKNNGYDLCKPIYRVTGEVHGTITINGIEITINVGQNLTIDTAKQLTYRTDTKEMINQGITADYEDIWLDNGPVVITASSGLTVTVEPRWGWEL